MIQKTDVPHNHYCWITNISRLVSYQTTHHKSKLFLCDRCLNYFGTEEELNIYNITCQKINDCKVSFSKKKYIKFKNFDNKEKLPFVVYCNFETMLVPFEEKIGMKTFCYQKHVPISVGFYLK